MQIKFRIKFRIYDKKIYINKLNYRKKLIDHSYFYTTIKLSEKFYVCFSDNYANNNSIVKYYILDDKNKYIIYKRCIDNFYFTLSKYNGHFDYNKFCIYDIKVNKTIKKLLWDKYISVRMNTYLYDI